MKGFCEKLEQLLELGGTKKDITLLVLSGTALLLSLAGIQPLPFNISWVAIVLCGVPILLEAFIGLVTAFDIKADVLVSLALIASVAIGEDFAAGEVAFIMQVGGLLEELTVARARAGIEKLVHLTPQTARALKNGQEQVIPAEEVRVGDTLRVLPGESIPVDGIITAGQTSINQAIMTGEIIRAVTILVVFCPCALVLATPTAIMAAIGNAAKHGFLVREGDALERLASVKVLAFDKTGTLTCGTPRVVAAKSVSPDLTDAQLYTLTASVETLSEHPLGRAIVRSHQQGEETPLFAPEQFRMIPGRGVAANVDGKAVLAGNPALLEENGCRIPASEALDGMLEQGCTVTYVAVDGHFAGYLALADTLRTESAATLKALSGLGIETALLTGDHASAANNIANKLGITEVHAGCLPEDKLNIIGEYQAAERPVCMIGDGVNDAPALKKANVGIAMGGTGSDIAVDAADIALVDDEVKELPHLMALFKRMMTTIRLNLTFSMTLNFVAIVLAITGILNPVVGALVHNAGSVLVIVNSALLLNWKRS